MKVLSHPSCVLYYRQLDVFQFREDVSPLIQEASSVLTNLEGSLQAFKLCVGVSLESLRTLVSSEQEGQLITYQGRIVTLRTRM